MKTSYEKNGLYIEIPGEVMRIASLIKLLNLLFDSNNLILLLLAFCRED